MNIATRAPLSSADASDDGSRSFPRRLLDFVFGYDFFISYSWRDGAPYASALASRLEADGFQVFLDRSSYASGDNWKKVGAWTLRRTSQLILVGSPAAIRSDPVIHEVEIFSKTRRKIVPINFAGSLDLTESDSGLAPYLPADIIKINEPAAALASGPSEETVADIRRTFNLVRQDKKRMGVLTIIALLLGVLTVAALMFATYAFFERKVAAENEGIAIKNEGISLEGLSEAALKDGHPIEAVQLALAAWPRTGDQKRPQMKRVLTDLAFAMSEYHERVRLEVPNPVQYAAFSPDGKRVITASEDDKAHIWDAETGEHLIPLGHEKAVWSAAFDSDGTRAITSSDDGRARIWDAKTGALLKELDRHGDSLHGAAFSPDGGRVVTASEDGTARVWNAGSGKVIAVLKGHHNKVWSAAFDPDGGRIVTASLDTTARIWNANTGKQVVKPLKHQGEVYSAAFSRDGAHIVTASEDRTVGIWNAKTGEVEHQLGANGKFDKFSAAAFSPDGTRIVTASYDGIVRIWDVGTGTVLIELKGHDDVVNSAAFSPDGTHIVTASDDKTARIWSTAAAPLLVLGHGDYVNKVDFSRDGARIVTACSDETARIWNAKTGALLTTFPSRKGAFKGDLGAMVTAAFNPQGDRVVTASDNAAIIWNATTGEPLITLDRQKWFRSAAFSPDGSRVVTAAEDKTARRPSVQPSCCRSSAVKTNANF